MNPLPHPRTCPAPAAPLPASRRRGAPEKAPGFTLLELVIVLGILSAITLLLTRDFAAGQHERRWNRSNDTLEELGRAIEGDRFWRPREDGDAPPPSFAADMGRLPRAVTNRSDESELTLGELFFRPENAVSFGVYPAWPKLCAAAGRQGVKPSPMDRGVRVPMGWRGPYLRLPPGRAEPFVRDGWGNPLVSRNAARAGRLDFPAGDLPNRLLGEQWGEKGTRDGIETGDSQEATNGMPVAFIRHLGGNGLSALTEGPEEGFDRDVSIAPVSNVFAEAVAGCVEIPTNISGALTLVVRLYGPPPAPENPADAARVMAWEWRASPDTLSPGMPVPFLLTNRTERMTAGPRIIRAAIVRGPVTIPAPPVAVRLSPGTNSLPKTLVFPPFRTL